MKNSKTGQLWGRKCKQCTLCCKCRRRFHKLIYSICNEEELLEEWKESIVPIYKKGDKTDCSQYRGVSLLSTTYKVLSNILLSRLTPYADEIIGDRQCEFRRNRSHTTLLSHSIWLHHHPTWHYLLSLHMTLLTPHRNVRNMQFLSSFPPVWQSNLA